MNRYWLPMIATAFLAMAARASELYILPRTGELTFTQTDQELPTPLGRLPILRSFDANEKTDPGPGLPAGDFSKIRFWINLASRWFRREFRFLFQKVGNSQHFDGPMGARASLEGREWIVQSGDGSSSRYDEKGENSHTDSNGNRITFAYDAGGRVLEIAGVAGYALKFRYGDHGRLAAIADSSGRSSEYQYDASRRHEVGCEGLFHAFLLRC